MADLHVSNWLIKYSWLDLSPDKQYAHKPKWEDAHFWVISRGHAKAKLMLTCVPACSVAQSCPTLCDLMDCSRPVSSVHGISQARILEWVDISSSRASPPPRDRTSISCVSCIAGQFFTGEHKEAKLMLNSFHPPTHSLWTSPKIH